MVANNYTMPHVISRWSPSVEQVPSANLPPEESVPAERYIQLSVWRTEIEAGRK